MRSRKHTNLASAAFAALGAVAACGLVVSSMRGVAEATPPPPDAPAKYYGAASCGGSNCHSAAEPRPLAPGLQEYTIWSTVNAETGIPYDRHGYAYNRLFDEKSKAIMEKLNKLEGTKGEAPDSERCLTCHGVSVHDYASGKGGTPVGKRKDLQGGKYEPADGVSCDGCHGPSEKYLKPHAEKDWAIKKWKELGSEKLYNEWGIYYSKDVTLWAGQCVRCHLAIDSNQIEAGHPDLVPFELFGQSAASSPHWRDYAAAEAAPELPASGAFHAIRVWQTGQAAAVVNAAANTASRARGEKHNDAKGDALTAHVREAAARALGHHAVLRHAAQRFSPEAAKAVSATAAALEAAIAEAKPDLKKVAAAADELAKAARPLAKAAAAAKVDMAYAKGLLAAVAGEPAALTERRTAEQTAMGLYAIYAGYLQQAKPEALAENPPTDAGLAAIYEMFGPLAGGAPHEDAAFKEALAKVKAAVAAAAK